MQSLPQRVEQRMMERALAIATAALGTTWPNPAVGCVLLDAAGRVVSEAATGAGGRPHAETLAIERATADLRGGTAYVSLEPCDHFGETPPCSVALIDAGIGRALVATLDPDPRVNGAGVTRLRQHGIAVSVGLMRAEADRLNAGFFSRVRQGRPFVAVIDPPRDYADPLYAPTTFDALLIEHDALSSLDTASRDHRLLVVIDDSARPAPLGPRCWRVGENPAPNDLALVRNKDLTINYAALLGLLGSRGLTRLAVHPSFSGLPELAAAGLIDATPSTRD